MAMTNSDKRFVCEVAAMAVLIILAVIAFTVAFIMIALRKSDAWWVIPGVVGFSLITSAYMFAPRGIYKEPVS
jgi:uncharacterized membrane protein YdcZ (DUF606 family)